MDQSTGKHLAVVGLGYVGLPLAVLAKEKGWQVSGLDIDEAKVEAINGGNSTLSDEQLDNDLKANPIDASVDPIIVSKADVIVVAVPTPVKEDKEPDLTPLISAIENIRDHLHTGQLLIIESTVNPGVTDDVVLPILRERNDLPLDTDTTNQESLYVAYCPERINPGDTVWSVRNISRVLGGYTEEGIKQAEDFYRSLLDEVDPNGNPVQIKLMNSVTEAEAVKILENSFRDVNIAFVNEMAQSFDLLGIDVVNVINGAATKPFAFLAHYPGNGVGGHCISVDPYYMIERAKQIGFDHKFLQLARDINNSMPEFATLLLERGMKDANLSAEDSTVAVLGVSYKKNTSDIRESPVLDILALLEGKNINVEVFDPYVPDKSTTDSLSQALEKSNIVMIGANHDEFTESLTPEKLKEHGVNLVIDGKNSLDPKEFQDSGIHYIGVGRNLKATK